MRKEAHKSFLLSLTIGVVMLKPCAFAQWMQTNGPYGETVQCFTADGDRLFAGTKHNGVYRTTNSGGSWTAVNTGLTSVNITALAVSDSTLFAGTADGGIFLSSNGGSTWVAVNAGLPISSVTSLAVAVGVICAGFSDVTVHGVYRSTDGGASWGAANTGLGTNAYVHSLASSGTNLFAGLGCGGVFQSTNGGASWTACADSGLSNNCVGALTAVGSDLFAGTEGGGPFRSTNNGASWTAVSGDSVPQDSWVYAISFSGATLFAGTDYGVLRFTDKGTTWAGINTSLVAPVFALALSGSGLLAGTDGGVFRSTDNGIHWVRSNAHLAYARVNALAASGVNLLAGTEGGGIFVSTDGGSLWTAVDFSLTDPSFQYVESFAVSGNTLFAGTLNGVVRSTDGGTSWSQAGLAGGWITALKIFGANLFACNQGGGLYISKNNGASWARTDSGIASGAPVTTLANGGSYLFAGAYGSGIYRSGNGGASWTRINSGFSDPLLRIRTMAVIDTNLFVGVDVYGVLRFTSDGTSWVYANQGLSNGNIRSLVVSDSSLFGGSYDGGGVFLSVNEGASWTSVSSGWPSQGLQSYDLALAVLGSNLFAGTGWGGVWRRPLSEMVASVMTSRTGLPVEYSLQQNYPNPFNPVTTIRYDLPTSSLVRLSVFDILGREVYVLVNEVKKAGSYEVKFDGSNLASGVYLCRMQTGSFIQARKLLLLR